MENILKIWIFTFFSRNRENSLPSDEEMCIGKTKTKYVLRIDIADLYTPRFMFNFSEK